jgi:superfamily I DNA/RNA helicase
MDSKDFIDYAGFYLALGAMDELLEATSGEAPEGVPAEVLSSLPAIREQRERANTLLKAIAPKMDEAIEVLVTQMTEKANVRVKTLIATSLTGNAYTAYRKRAKMLRLVFTRMIAHSNVLRETLEEVASKGVAVAKAASMAPVDTIAAVANISVASGSNARLKNWTMGASEILGRPVSEEDRLANDIVEAKTLAREAHVVGVQIGTLDPGDSEVEQLAEKKAHLDMVTTKVIEQSVNPTAVQSTVANQKAEDGQKQALTIVGQRLKGGLTPAQEKCVMSSGKVIMAAGAGSGKTRVIAAKVVHHMQERGHDASSIMAVSFSKKSAAELKARVVKFGNEAGVDMGDPESASYNGMGTTHAVALKILIKSGSFRGILKSNQVSGLMRAAVAQVKMAPVGNAAPMTKESMTFFPNLGKANFDYIKTLTEVKQPVEKPAISSSPLNSFFEDAGRFANLMGVVQSALMGAKNSLSVDGRGLTTKYGEKTKITVSGPGITQFGNAIQGYTFNGARATFKLAEPQYRSPDRYEWWVNGRGADVDAFKNGLFAAVGLDKVGNSLNAVLAMGRDPSVLTDADKSLLQVIVSQPLVSTALAANKMSVKTAAKGDDESLEAIEEKMNEAEAKNEKSDFHYWLNNPANQWFNIGASEEHFKVSDGRGGKKNVGMGAFKRYIGLHKNNLRAPGELYMGASGGSVAGMVGEDTDEGEEATSVSDRILSAVYGAYEWLKSNDPKMQGQVDFDDMLIQTVRALTEKPNLLRQLQTQYKCILVDEAQDLNVVQHKLFGLIAGYEDPKTLTPRKDGKLTAETFAFIGDDKQAIYEFRGAEPDQFIEKSDQFGVSDKETGVEKKGDFQTLLLDKNFRSGSAIVKAANELIRYNSKQIKMVCTTDDAKGEGTILREQIKFENEGPSVVVSRILSDMEDVKNSDGKLPEKFYKQYGLAARTNRELLQYQMALIEEGIPFRSKRDPFEGPALRPIVSLFRMFLPGTAVTVRNKGFLDGLLAPSIGVSPKTVADRMEGLKVGDYYDFCKNGGYEKLYNPRSDQFKALKEYSTVTLPKLEEIVTEGSSKEFLEMVANTKGVNGQTFIDQLAVSVRNDPEAMEEAQDLADSDDGDGVITDDILRQLAAKPLDPLYKLADKYPKAPDFIGYLNSLATKSIQTNKTDDNAKENDDLVTLDTVHGWKGLECKHLFVPMAEGRFPIIRPENKDHNRALESERRLAYVALTRGEQSVTIIEPTMRERGDKVVPVKPSRFVEEACIKVKGAQPKTASKIATTIKVAVETGDYSAFLMPLYDQEGSGTEDLSLESEWGDIQPDSDDMVEEDLLSQWGETLDETVGEEN